MTIVYNTLPDLQIGFSLVFMCIGFGFFVLRGITAGIPGPGYWGLCFFSNAFGFLCWSGILPFERTVYYLAGEAFHILGFGFMVVGALAFTEVVVKKAAAATICSLWAFSWLATLMFFSENDAVAIIVLKYLRSVPIAACGLMLILGKDDGEAVGRRIAGYSLLFWGIFISLSVFFEMSGLVYFSLLVGLQTLAAFGMVAMLVNRIKVKNEDNEKHIEKLEGILPICSYCKKIRDKEDNWKLLEEYIEDRTDASFSHGICPECFEKHRPDR